MNPDLTTLKVGVTIENILDDFEFPTAAIERLVQSTAAITGALSLSTMKLSTVTRRDARETWSH